MSLRPYAHMITTIRHAFAGTSETKLPLIFELLFNRIYVMIIHLLYDVRSFRNVRHFTNRHDLRALLDLITPDRAKLSSYDTQRMILYSLN